LTRVSNNLRRVAATAVAVTTILTAAGAFAQPHGGHGGPPAGHGHVVVAAPIYYYGYGFYDPFWGAMWAPYYGWYGPPGYYYGVPVFEESAARLQVKPKATEVYVDGYLAGTVESFDGFLQRLNVPPGEHTVTFYLDGYHTVSQKILFRPHTTLNIKYELQKLAAGETSEPRPEPAPHPDAPETRAVPGTPAGPPPDTPSQASGFGTLSLRVQPREAAVVVDGQEWQTEGAGPLTIELPEGLHVVEVHQDGFTPFRRTVQIRPGTTTTLNVSLSR
jgi:hypothetical protein